MGLVVPKAEAGMKSVSSRCLPASRESGSKHKVQVWSQTMFAQKILFFLTVIPGAQEVAEKPLNPESLLSQGGGKNNVHM